ncbi:hypothetical protein DPEC_G00380430 [Dallia pectoralis]|nr:hypothetical protein DPEC_G00380430 [Dallia pectoralis]
MEGGHHFRVSFFVLPVCLLFVLFQAALFHFDQRRRKEYEVRDGGGHHFRVSFLVLLAC